PGAFLTRQTQARVLAEADAQEDRVERGEQIRAPQILADLGAGAELDAERRDPLDLAERVVGLELVGGDAVRVEAPRQRALLEDDGAVALERQVRRARERRGTAADERDALSRLRFGAKERRLGELAGAEGQPQRHRVLGRVALEAPDLDGRVIP